MLPIRILVVEDEGIVAKDIEQQLLRFGYEPICGAVTGEQAIALAEQTRPALALMDIRLTGGIDGIEAAAVLRSRLGIPSVFLTAYASDEVVERAKVAEPLGYIIKPFDEQNLRTTLEIALHKHRLDEQLRASEARFRAIVDSAREAIVTIDAQGQVATWSLSATRMFGYAAEEVIGRSVFTLWPAEMATRYAGLVETKMAGGSIADEAGLEVIGMHRDGRRLVLEASIATWESSEGRCLTAVLRDVTDRRKASATLRLQSAALNAAANGIVITDTSGVIEWVNPAFSTLTGYSFEEAVGRNPNQLVRSGTHDQTFYEEMWSTILAGNVWTGELTNRRKDGTLYVEEQTITPVPDETGAISHFVGIKRDLTAQKHLEAQFVQAQKMEVVGRLAGGIAHDFNNLLTVINGTSDLVLRTLPGDDPLRADFQQIKNAGDRAAGLTHQLLAFSRKQLVAPVVLNLSAQVGSTAKMLQRLMGEDIRLEVTATPDLADVKIDPGHFEQVLMNLAVNARDAMPKGGSLMIDMRNTLLDSEFALDHPEVRPGPHVLLAVSDTGTGMTATVRKRVFEPFFTTKAHGHGTGLGLATVKDILRQSGGCVTVESEPGAGATFSIYLPCAAAPAAQSSAPAAGPSRGGETILLVEDDANLRDLAVRMLRDSGYTVVPAAGGDQALELLGSQAGRVDLMLTDVVMPGMSGPELAVQVARHWPAIRVLFTSGYTDDRLTSKALEEGAHFIAKPFTVATLTLAVRRVLDEGAPR